MLGERPGQIERLRVACFFDSLFVENASIDATGVGEIVAAFKLSGHRDFRNDPVGMKNELTKYLAAVEMILSLSHRVDKRGDDCFLALKWWLAQLKQLKGWCHALRGVLAHAPSSTAVDCVFSILNDAFGDDQLASPADYTELSLQLQFNNRGRKRSNA